MCTAIRLAVLTVITFTPAVLYAQTGSIAGVVRDTSGAGHARRHRGSLQSCAHRAGENRDDRRERASTRSSSCGPGAYTVTFTLRRIRRRQDEKASRSRRSSRLR